MRATFSSASNSAFRCRGRVRARRGRSASHRFRHPEHDPRTSTHSASGPGSWVGIVESDMPPFVRDLPSVGRTRRTMSVEKIRRPGVRIWS
jgi:hypothetical protein